MKDEIVGQQENEQSGAEQEEFTPEMLWAAVRFLSREVSELQQWRSQVLQYFANVDNGRALQVTIQHKEVVK